MVQDEGHLTLHIATLQNAAELARLLSAIEDEPVSPGEVRERLEALQGTETTILAIAGDRAVGLACLRLLPSLSSGLPAADLTEFYIEKAYQGGEIESALLARAEGLAMQHGASQLSLLTGLRNTKAQALYRSLGYRDYALAMRKLIGRMKDEG